MCKQILTAVLLLGTAFINFSTAQEIKPPCQVKGIVSNHSGAILQGATVQILHTKDPSPLKSSVTSAKGSFEIVTGCDSIHLKVTMAGYEPYDTSMLPSTEMGALRIVLKANFKDLSTVEVRASRRNIEVRNDRTVINVEAVVSNTGANALEVLEKSPGIAVDQDGNISMQGKQGVMVMIDGKQSQLNNAELAALLRSLSSSQIDQIELITQPSARYDASGNAGVINIKMKRNKTADFNGNMATSITQGKYTRLNQSVVLDKRFGRAAFSFGYTGAYLKGFYDFTIIRKLSRGADHTTNYFAQRTINPFQQTPHNLRLSMDYAINKQTSIALNHTLLQSSYKDAPVTNGFSEVEQIKSLDRSTGSNHIKRLNYSIGMNFRRVIDSAGKELLVDGDFFSYNRKNNQGLYSELLNEQGHSIDDPYHLKGYNPSFIQIAAGKVDYIHPFNKRWKVESGFKLSHITTENNSFFERQENGNWEPDERGSDFTYKERILAGYINLFGTLKHWKGQVGLRTEATAIQALALMPIRSRTTEYIDLFPTVSLNYEKKKGQVFSLYYSNRIDRPNYQDMNPFQIVFNQYTYVQGNPVLIPQYTQVIEAGYAYKSNFNIKSNYSVTKDVIGDVIFQDEETYIAYQQKVNLSSRHVLSLNSTLVIPVTKRWSSTIFGNLLYTSYKGQFATKALQHEAYSFNFTVNNQFRFNKGWTAELSSSYFHKNYLTALFFNKEMGFVNAGIAKQVLGGKGSLRLAARDIFRTQYNRYIIDFKPMNIYFKQRQDASNLTLGFTYRFGKGNTTQRKRSSSTAEEINRVGNN